MSQVQNSTLHNFVQPALFLGAAFLAGRSIQNFPGASKGGLLLSATLGSTIALASQYRTAEYESAWHSLARVTISLALGTILAPYAAKALNGRADITMPAALRFGLVETVIAMGLAVISSNITGPSDPRERIRGLHSQYGKDLDAWDTLSKEKRTQLVKQFYEEGLDPFYLQAGWVDEDVLNAYRNFDEMTANQLGWHVQMLVNVVDYSDEDLFALNLALHAKGLPMEWDQGISLEQVDYAQDKPVCVNLLYAYFTAHPIEFAQMQEQGTVDFGDMFDGKAPILLTNLEPAAIKQLSKEDLTHLLERINDREPHHHQRHFSIAQQVSLNIAAQANGVNGLWIWPINEEVVAIVKADEDACNWFHYEFTQAPAAYAAIEEGLRGQLDAHFVTKELDPIANAADILAELTAEMINDFEQALTWGWHIYFEVFPNAWEAQSKEKGTAFISDFAYFNLPLLSLDKVEIDFDQLWQPKLEEVKELGEVSIKWLLALEAKQEFLNEDVLAALQPQEAESDGSEDL